MKIDQYSSSFTDCGFSSRVHEEKWIAGYGSCATGRFKPSVAEKTVLYIVNPFNLIARCRDSALYLTNSSDPDQRAPSVQGLNCLKIEIEL